ncbi:hypothetical protein MNEG_12256, partial [Monoraphidium neglectum]
MHNNQPLTYRLPANGQPVIQSVQHVPAQGILGAPAIVLPQGGAHVNLQAAAPQLVQYAVALPAPQQIRHIVAAPPPAAVVHVQGGPAYAPQPQAQPAPPPVQPPPPPRRAPPPPPHRLQQQQQPQQQWGTYGQGLLPQGQQQQQQQHPQQYQIAQAPPDRALPPYGSPGPHERAAWPPPRQHQPAAGA